MKKLIINADGFGFTYGINRAIFEVAEFGSISSISVNCNFKAVEQLQIFHKKFPNISIGVHLNPIVGKPVSNPEKIPSLINSNGEFWNEHFAARIRKKKIALHELFEELLAQVNFILKMGIPVTHLDSHQNLHLLPGYFKVFLKVAKMASIPRMRSHRHYIGAECERPQLTAAVYYATHLKTTIMHLYTRLLMLRAQLKGMRMANRLICVGHVSGKSKGELKVWEKIFSNLPSGVNEIYCHPGYPDDTLRRNATYIEERNNERKVLLSPKFLELLKHYEINLIDFNCI